MLEKTTSAKSKYCTACLKLKPLEDFHMVNRAYNRRSKECKACKEAKLVPKGTRSRLDTEFVNWNTDAIYC